jgi:tetratricopeptide (TPR) repeat protein
MSEKYKTLNDLKDIGKLFGIDSPEEKETIGFLGREKEFGKIKTFLSSQRRILEICGVPMIGKTSLTKEFCDKHNIPNIRIVFTNSQLPKVTIQNDLFKEREWDDFSGFTSNTLIIVENFENALEWTPQNDHLHEIVADKIHNFLNGALQSGLKIIVESRFQIRFDLEQRYFVQTEFLKPIDTQYFWEFYQTKGFSEQDFETLCQKFDEHTGLLAIAYNDASWLYENELTKAIYEPSATLKNLWNLLEIIVKKLQKPERQLLATLTILQKPVSKVELNDYVRLLIKESDIDKYLESLRKKLLATSSPKAEYSINPYIAEVCYSFFEKTSEVSELKKLPAFKEIPLPEYNRIKQASDKGDYSTFYRLVKELRKNKKYKDVHQILKYALEYDNIINKAGVLNEIGVTYKEQKKYSEAKKVLEKARELGNIHSFNELSIIYKTEGNYKKARQILEEALLIEPENIKILNELAIDYRGEKNYVEAKRFLGKILNINDKDVKAINELAIVYKEEKNYVEAKRILEKALKREPNNEFLKDNLNDLEAKVINMQKENIKQPHTQINADGHIYIEPLGKLTSTDENKFKSKILFLCANPSDTSRLRIDEEVREIEEGLRRSKKRDNFDFKVRLATRVRDLSRAILDDSPQILHFSGHGETEGIILEDEDGTAKIVTTLSIGNLFSLFSDTIKCVILNSCYSKSQAEEISKYIPFVIGMSKSVPDTTAITFATSFYDAIGAGKEIELAFKFGVANINLEGLKGSEIPILIKGH